MELTLKEEFGDRAAELSLDKEPLGTASIAQAEDSSLSMCAGARCTGRFGSRGERRTRRWW